MFVGYGLVGLQTGGVSVLLQSLAMIVALFASVVLHELGHALAAKGFGIQTAHITLYPFGGIAALKEEPKTPAKEFWVAIAGPLVNFVLMTLALLAYLATGWTSVAIFAGLNFVMGVFNMLPAFPMDGGRVLRAGLSPILGWWKASRVAITIGRVFALGFLVLGAVTWSMNLLIVGGFLLFATTMERRRLRLLKRQRSVQAPRPGYVPRWRIRPRSS